MRTWKWITLLALILVAPAGAAEFAPISLDSYANYTPAASDLLAAPRKGSDFDRVDGVDIRLASLSRGGKNQLAVGLVGNQPTAIRGIRIGYSGVKSLHFFHSVIKGNLRPGSFVCKYVVHYDGGKVAEIPVVAGQNVGSTRAAQGVPGAKAIQAVVDDAPRSSFIYHMSWHNRFPKARIVSLDMIAVSPGALVALSGLTLELQPISSMPAKIARDYNTLGRLWREFQNQSDSASIFLLGGDYSAAKNKLLREVIDGADAARLEILSLRKALRAASGGQEPRDLKSRLSVLSNKRNSIQETLTKTVRSQ